MLRMKVCGIYVVIVNIQIVAGSLTLIDNALIILTLDESAFRG